ncbi:MAG: motility protein A [bacterium]|nr:motility protein A [bacterium]MCP4799175.1 motility protein A [bacterium]
MDFATIIGLLGASGMIIWAVSSGGTLNMFYDGAAIAIVVGGTAMAIMGNYPIKRVLGMASVIKKTILFNSEDPEAVIGKMVHYAERARKEGMLALEEDSENEDDLFLRKGLRLAVDGTDPSLLEKILGTDIEQLQTRHKEGKQILEAGGTFAPAFGMIGTLVGLIQMLSGLDDPSSIGSGMAVALLTTFYGAVMANVFFLPLAGKLETRSRDEVLIREMIIDGIMAIQTGDSPRIVEEKLKSFLSPSIQRKLSDERENEAA